ncbi:hypothetical protein KAX01_01730 [Candidatus Bathyarchaeota archaeon]|nr:hypothetical protein [Candidatus Bathyarchaeota archaeon]MCK4436121.1 hypothetical protein [Candidatus Bathyarchaeota archaeon]
MTYSLTYLVKEFLDERYPTHEKKWRRVRKPSGATSQACLTGDSAKP